MAGKNYVDRLLTNVAFGHRPFGHINELILKPYPVKQQSGKIGVYDASNLRLVTAIKSPEGGTPTVTMNVSQADAYLLQEHAIKVMASQKEIDNQESPFDAQRDKTEFVMDLLSTAREYALANFMNTDTN